jgi:hypothetical protein
LPQALALTYETTRRSEFTVAEFYHSERPRRLCGITARGKERRAPVR